MKTFIDYINEVTEKQLEPIQKRIKSANNNKLKSFSNIFGNKLRVVIPINSEKVNYPLIHNLEQLGYKVDLDKGTVSYKVNTFECEKCKRKIQASEQPKVCPSCQNPSLKNVPGFTKERTERIGTVLNRNIKLYPNQDWKNLLKWWEQNKSKEDDSGISIIISRHPLDIIRMSDHRELDSCHSPPNSKNTTGWKAGSFHKCARQEALTGGAVAFAVRTQDLKNINLQAPEIFKDRDRNINGIEPLERVRLRKFSDGNIDLLLPEKRTYGIKHVGFLDAVLNWAKNTQKKITEQPLNFKNFDLYGGSYQDTNADTIWNQFFGTNVTGNKKSVNQEDETEGEKVTADSLYQDARNALNDHDKLKHINFHFDVNDDGGGFYLYYMANIWFSFLKKDFNKIPDWQDVSYRSPLKKAIQDAFNFSIEDIQVNSYSDKVGFSFDLDLRTETYARADQRQDLVEFESALDYADEIESDYYEHYQKLKEILIQHEFLKQEPEIKFKHFKFIDPQKIQSEPIWIGYLDTNKALSHPDIKISTYKIFKVEANQKVINFSSLEIYQSIKSIFPKTYLIQPDDFVFKLQALTKEQSKIFVEMHFEIYSKREEAIKKINLIKYIDKNWDVYARSLAAWWAQTEKYLFGQDKLNTEWPRPKIQLTPDKQKRFDFKEFVESVEATFEKEHMDRKTLESVMVDYHVYKNPTKEELNKAFQEDFNMRWDTVGTRNLVRGLLSQEGDVYIWASSGTEHDSMRKKLRLHYPAFFFIADDLQIMTEPHADDKIKNNSNIIKMIQGQVNTEPTSNFEKDWAKATKPVPGGKLPLTYENSFNFYNKQI